MRAAVRRADADGLNLVVPRGDANCDGVVSNFDIDAFVLALVGGEAGWSQVYDCDFLCAADINLDGVVNNFDIDPFVALPVGP
ncbi:MAG: hypothetical protein AB7Q17_06150 [Phycisphaerae bacterium]